MVALLMALLVVVGQPVQALAKQRIAVAQVGNPRDGLAGDPGDGLDGDPGDGFGGDPGDGDEGDPTDGEGDHALAGDPGDGDGVTASAGFDVWAQYGWPVWTNLIVAMALVRIRGR
ncbi:MAG: hypothetical protein IPG61_02160 [bacterium]|nr:hypothetical protein [bacterium]